MTDQAFFRGMLDLETFFARKLTERERTLYRNALGAMTDDQWEACVDYALKAWKLSGRLPNPGQMNDWAGIQVETPAERQAATQLEGTPVVNGEELSARLDEAKKTGTLRAPGTFWSSKAEQWEYENASEEVLLKAPVKGLLGTPEVFARVALISSLAQKKLAQYRKEDLR